MVVVARTSVRVFVERPRAMRSGVGQGIGMRWVRRTIGAVVGVGRGPVGHGYGADVMVMWGRALS